jgi:pSer/pThr/pTyr-binding forkhead associated (FHA) protein
MNELDSFFCELDGTPLSVATKPPITGPLPVSGPVGVLVMPDQSEVAIQQTRRVFGRKDLNKFLKPENVKEVSRVHFTIVQENGEFYLQDGGPDPKNRQAWKRSVNGTSVNGAILEPSAKQKLNINDVIDVSQLGINLTFKTR